MAEPEYWAEAPKYQNILNCAKYKNNIDNSEISWEDNIRSLIETETKEWHAGITKWTKKKLLTSLDGYGILLKLSREELLHNSKKEIKKLLTNMKRFDII